MGQIKFQRFRFVQDVFVIVPVSGVGEHWLLLNSSNIEEANSFNSYHNY